MKRLRPEIEFRDAAYQRWILQCCGCGRVGHRSDLPEQTTARVRLGSDFEGFTTALGKNLRKVFDPLEVNEAGLCDVCQRATELSS
jgi:hypothetical protein